MIPEPIKHLFKLAGDNSPLLLTSVGVAGVVGTALLTGRATLYADRMIKDEQDIRFKDTGIYEPLPLKEQVNLVWKQYIPPVLVGVGTITAIIASHRIGGQRTAAMAAAFTMSTQSFENYREKVVEQFGEKKERRIHDAVMEDRVAQAPVPNGVMVVGDGKVPCYDSWSGRYFASTMEDLKKAMNDLNYKILNSYDNSASLSDFYNLVGLPPIQGSDEFGWNVDKLLEIEFTSCLTPDQKPAIAMNYRVEPKRSYFRR